MKPKGFYYTRWKPELPGTAIVPSRLLYSPPVSTDAVPEAPANRWPAEVNSATEAERAQERKAWLLAKLGGEYSVFELSKTGRISYGGLDSWLGVKITNQTPTMRGKLVKALKKIGISCSISEVPQ